MNKAEIETISIDDLYNNFKIVEQSVKKSIGASSGAQNLAFMTAPSTRSTNDVNTAKPAYEVSTVSPNVNTASPQVSTASFSDNVVYAFMVENPNGSNLLQQDLEQIHEDDLEAMDLKWQLSLLSMRAKRYFQRTCKKIFINANDAAGYDKSKVECFNYHKIGHFARKYREPRNKEGQFRYQDNTRKQGNNEDTSSKAMLAIDGVGFDWSDMAEEQVQTNMALMAFSDSEVYNDKTCSKTCLKNYETLKKQCDDLIVKLNQTEFTTATYKRVLKREVACKDYEINVLKSEFEKVKQEKEGIEFKIEKFDNASKSLNKLLESQITDKSKKGLGYNVVPPPHPLIYNRPKKLDLSYSGLDEFKEPEFKSYGSEDRQVSEDTSSFVESSLNVDKETIFLDKKIELTNQKDHENRVKNQLVFSAKPMSRFSKSAQSTIKRPYQSKTVSTNKKFTQTNNTTKAKAVNIARPKAVNTARPHSAVVNVVRGKPQQDDIGFIDSGFSRHMTGNIAYLSYFMEFDRDVFFVNELNFNIFSVSQMCDKKNYVLFTDTECLVLSPNFKLPDESQILLKIPRKDNMYNFDIKNIVPKESLTCLVAKATSDESMLWHRRLSHINFKNINKLVKDNLGSNTKLLVSLREKGIRREYSVARTPQQNGVAERRNRILIETARTMFGDSKLPITIWAEAVSTACYFDGKSDKGFFVEYSLSSKAFRVYNTRTRRVEENLHIRFLENKPMIEGNGAKYTGRTKCRSTKSAAGDPKQVEDGPDNENDEKDKFEDDSSPKEVNTARQHVNTTSPKVNTGRFKLNTVDPSVSTASSYDPDSPKDMFKMGASHTLEATHVEFFSDEDEPEVDLGNITNSYTVPTTPNTRIHKDHPITNVIGYVKSSIQIRRMTKSTSEQGFLSVIEPTSIAKALSDSSWVEAMQEELLIEAIRLFLAYASFMGFLVYQMDVKSAFLYRTIKEEVYVTQPPGFKDPNYPDKVYKVVKALYGLHQAPRASYALSWKPCQGDSLNLPDHRFRRRCCSLIPVKSDS
ncbi:putative ribonuclease H-like domain-containing protein [Tanacetum coccineum]|uniref:Ribonuclease H-like domain-containing protein n=1 Tax=Tanacetum coccineum TaxID=301880 RepID=A0ABQ4ZUZ9_9ASTR